MFGQPRDVLRPSAFSVEAAEKWALDRSAKLPADLFRLTALWSISFVRQPVPEERRTHYTMRLAQSQNYGLSAALGRRLRSPDADIVGLDTRVILKKKLYKSHIDRTALVDLVMGHVSRPADRKIRLDSTLREKYEARAEIFASEAEGVLRRKRVKDRKGRRPRALVIGATAGIISRLVKRGFRVLATDFSPAVVGLRLGGVKVESGRDANAVMKEADVAIITGMTLPNRTLPDLIELAKEHNTSTMIWAISGRNFGHYYTDHGVDCVISDPSPFLLLPGTATVAIWRRRARGG
jgi:Putative heavy-metal chelation